MQRNNILDAAKGITIIIVVFHHISFAAVSQNASELIQMNTSLHPLYISWFMPIFFLITGYCSTFKKSFHEFCLSNLRTILWPAITSFILIYSYRSLLASDIDIFLNSLDVFLLWGGNWFLCSLFFSKMLVWLIVNKTNIIILRYTVIILLSFLGVFLFNRTSEYCNYLHYCHTLYFSLYIFLGIEAQKYRLLEKKVINYLGLSFLPMFYLFHKTVGIPGIAGMFMSFDVIFLPIHFLLSITGACFVILISKILQNTKTIIFFGKNSLIIYLFHIEALRLTVSLCDNCINPSTIIQLIIFDCLALSISMSVCSVLILLFRTKYLHWIIRFPSKK